MSFGIYEACYHSSWHVKFPLKDARYSAAKNGDITAQGGIVMVFKAHAMKRYPDVKAQIHTRYIDFDHSDFSIRRVGDAPTPRKKVAR